jgi:hypothetical protein
LLLFSGSFFLLGVPNSFSPISHISLSAELTGFKSDYLDEIGLIVGAAEGPYSVLLTTRSRPPEF